MTDVIRMAAKTPDYCDCLYPNLDDQRPSNLIYQMLELVPPTAVPGKIFIRPSMDRPPVGMCAGLSQALAAGDQGCPYPSHITIDRCESA
jgi:hypothetical protein